MRRWNLLSPIQDDPNADKENPMLPPNGVVSSAKGSEDNMIDNPYLRPVKKPKVRRKKWVERQAEGTDLCLPQWPGASTRPVSNFLLERSSLPLRPGPGPGPAEPCPWVIEAERLFCIQTESNWTQGFGVFLLSSFPRKHSLLKAKKNLNVSWHCNNLYNLTCKFFFALSFPENMQLV